MRIFFARHGQVLPKSYYQGNASLPMGNSALSQLGCTQAQLLGKRLKELGFNGVIYSSPYDRTMQTADIVAKEVGAKVIPVIDLHEISNVKEPTWRTVGTGAEMVAKFSSAQAELDKEYTWFEEKAEDLSDVMRRLKECLGPLLSGVSKDMDVLLVAHAATAVALRHLFGVEEENCGFHWNCHLSLLYSTDGEKYACDVQHLPENALTGNSLNYLENKSKFDQTMKDAKCFLQSNEGTRVLHISDTHSANYRYYQQLFEKLSPDVIIHTGDLADELKAGRIEAMRPYWKEAAAEIIKMMERTPARVIIVPGNNDIEETLSGLARRAEVLPRNTVVSLGGKTFQLCHELNRLDESIGADFCLYGHGLTGETRTPEDNQREGKRYYNACWGVSLHVPEKNASMILLKVQI